MHLDAWYTIKHTSTYDVAMNSKKKEKIENVGWISDSYADTT